MEMLAQISGDSVIHGLIYIIVIGVIFGLLFWLINYCGLPAPFDKLARVVLAVAAVIICINVLLSMAGHPVFTFR
jgi:hypothetical protein